jgi:hypothetical protein
VFGFFCQQLHALGLRANAAALTPKKRGGTARDPVHPVPSKIDFLPLYIDLDFALAWYYHDSS